jgi:hypothetical protein
MKGATDRLEDFITAVERIASALEALVEKETEVARLQEENDQLRDKLNYSGEA